LGPLFFQIRSDAALTSERISELVASNFLNITDSVDICRVANNPGHFGRTSTTSDGSKFRRNDPEVAAGFKSKPRLFGQRIELRMELAESIKMEEIWKEENKLDHWNSNGKVQANLFVGGFPGHTEAYVVEEDVRDAGFDTDLHVCKMKEYRGEFHVRFLYNPFKHEFFTFLNPSTFRFSYSGSIVIKEWGGV